MTLSDSTSNLPIDQRNPLVRHLKAEELCYHTARQYHAPRDYRNPTKREEQLNKEAVYMLTIIAWCPMKDIEPYAEPKFRIGEIVVENGIIGTITAINKDGTLLVVGGALMPMTFTPSMCRLATSGEALSLGAKWREQGMYYDIKTNELKRL